jgi:hypothetical protein
VTTNMRVTLYSKQHLQPPVLLQRCEQLIFDTLEAGMGKTVEDVVYCLNRQYAPEDVLETREILESLFRRKIILKTLSTIVNVEEPSSADQAKYQRAVELLNDTQPDEISLPANSRVLAAILNALSEVHGAKDLNCEMMQVFTELVGGAEAVYLYDHKQ